MEKKRILMIETSTECCSVALSEGDRVIAEKVCESPRLHASILAPYISEVLEAAPRPEGAFDAVAVSEGPGSYTGLRVGVSTAKGLCFGSGKPLIAVDTLMILALQAEASFRRIIPMIDARRMEVYAACFDSECRKLGETRAIVLDSESFREELEQGTVLFIGTGAEKFREVCRHPNASFQSCFPLAKAMLRPSLQALQKEKFEDTAYFEPYYLKEFVAGISRKSVL